MFSTKYTSVTNKRKRLHGATLVEVLVTMVVVSLGLLGIVGLQLAATKYQVTAQFRTEAANQASAMAERIRANTAALTTTPLDSGSYVSADAYDNAAVPANDPACGSAAQVVCTQRQTSQKDLREWRITLAQTLPGGRGSIMQFLNTSTLPTMNEPRTRDIVVMWREKNQFQVDENEQELQADPNCPTPRVVGVRCFRMTVTP